MLLNLVQDDFEPEVRTRGTVYANTGRVKRLRIDRQTLVCQVQGSHLYDVIAELNTEGAGWDILALCDCPYAQQAPCKHIWAAFAKAGNQIVYKWGVPPVGNIRLYIDPADFEDAIEDPRGAAAAPSRRSKPTEKLLARRESNPDRPRKEKPPAWQRLLNQAPDNRYYGRPTTPRGPIPQLAYILDVGRSYLNGHLTIALTRLSDLAARSKRTTITQADIPQITDPADRTICAMLTGAARPGRESAYGVYDRSDAPSSIWQLDPGLHNFLLPLLAETGRLYWARDDESQPEPLRIEETPWELAIIVRTDPAPDIERHGRTSRAPDAQLPHHLQIGLVRGDHTIPLSEPDLVTRHLPANVLYQNALSPLQTLLTERHFEWITRFPPTGILPQHTLPLIRALQKRGIKVPVRWPADWPIPFRADIPPRPTLTIGARTDYKPVTPTLDATLAFRYADDARTTDTDGLYVEGSTPDGQPAVIRRDHDAERTHAATLHELGAKQDRDKPDRVTFPAKKLGGIAAALMSRGWEIRGEHGQFRTPTKLDIRVSTGIDWFDVQGAADFDGAAVPIADLLESLKRGETFVTLSDGSQGMLPEEWLAKHAAWLRLGAPAGEGLRFGRAQLSLIDALLLQTPEATCDEQLAAARARLAQFTGIRPADPAKTFRGELRPYQRTGLGWLRFLSEFGFGGCLADDMGLGKTVQILAFLADRATPKARADAGPWLLVAPRSLIFNWQREADRFTPHLRTADYTGADRSGPDSGFNGADLVLTTFGTLRRDIERLSKIDFAGVVLDEAQAIKNATSQIAKATRLLRARQRLALTGTPVENSLDDLWSIFEFLNPGMLGSASAFATIARAAGQQKDAADLALIRQALRPFILRRAKRDVAPELPERTEQTILCDLSGKQETLYRSLQKHYRDQLLGRIDRDGLNKSQMHVLEALLRLRQAACHPTLIEPKAKKATSAKVETLTEMLAQLQAEGNKALVFSQFTSFLDLVQTALDAAGVPYLRLDGSTNARERQALVDRFQTGDDCPVFLLSLKAGGVGLNLTAAQYVFLLDPWWNPAVEAQAIDRTHRIGQNRSVTAYRLIAKGTVEERILELQATKRDLAEAIVEEQGPALKALTREDLEWILT